jgi:hypothetical protein
MISNINTSNIAASNTTASPLFADVFDAPIPRGLRELTRGMTWSEVDFILGSAGGPVRLGQWQCTDSIRGSGPLGPQLRNFSATLAIGDRIATSIVAAAGPIAALTAMLYARGIAIEMLNFHQLRSGEHTATFIRGSNGAREEWAMGWSTDATQSALQAVVASANRLA